jgi:hypothetical protein
MPVVTQAVRVFRLVTHFAVWVCPIQQIPWAARVRTSALGAGCASSILMPTARRGQDFHCPRHKPGSAVAHYSVADDDRFILPRYGLVVLPEVVKGQL